MTVRLALALLLGACSRAPVADTIPPAPRIQPSQVGTEPIAASPDSTALPAAAANAGPLASVVPSEQVLPSAGEGTAELATIQPDAPEAEVLVTRDDPTLPPGCRAQEVAALIASFVGAFNRGDQDHLARFFLLSAAQPGPGGNDAWYAVVEPGEIEPAPGEPPVFTAYDTRELLPYFARRHQAQERLRLLSVKVSPQSGAGRIPGSIWLTFVLERQADDLDSQRQFVKGKGAIACDQQQIWRWVMYVPQEGNASAMIECSLPPDWKPDRKIVACAAPNL